MRLTPASRLGPYEISAQIGAGGMGEVFRARDTRLNRTVAIKVLSAHVDARRLEQEARAISGLNHPHICTLYDIGQQDGAEFMVMEYLDGETLSNRLKKGPLTVDQALQFACEIAEALDEAHRRGVIHRDLKPGNVMLVKTGSRVSSKLLDFGLAKIVQRSPSPENSTAALPLTNAGAIMGRPRYIAPEQLEGQPADARTDIYAFGLVLHETLGGQQRAQLVAGLVKRCLAQDAEDRWQSARDLRSASGVGPCAHAGGSLSPAE